MDALRQDLVCEFHVDDRIFDGCFLHDWDMFATAQNKYLHIYDSQGVELHCMRTIRSPRALQFLPYHYLLVSCSETGFLSYLDVSVGSIVNAKNTHCGKPTCFIQNPHNAVVLHGSSWGRVSMWSPGERDALVTMFCHHGPVLAAAVDLEGKYLVTSGNDAHVKVSHSLGLRGRFGTYEPMKLSTTILYLCQYLHWHYLKQICWHWESERLFRCGMMCLQGR